MQDAVLTVDTGRRSTGPARSCPSYPRATSRSRRFYFEQWILALIKYLQTADNPDATLAQIDANPRRRQRAVLRLRRRRLRERRSTCSATTSTRAMQAPTTSRSRPTSHVGHQQLQFARYNFRGEKALYTALTTTPGDLPGAEPLYLSNMVGQPGAASHVRQLRRARSTRTRRLRRRAQRRPCAGIPGPVDLGNPLYAPLPGRVRPVLPQHRGAQLAPAHALADDGRPDGLPAHPERDASRSPSGATPTTRRRRRRTTRPSACCSPYLPEGADIGFPVTIDGSRDKFYNTNQIDIPGSENFAGTVRTRRLRERAAATGGRRRPAPALVVRAIETQNYLGLVFACAQPNPTMPGATGRARRPHVRQRRTTILNWISAHPDGHARDCGIQIKYSIYGNYADYISSLNNGVRFGLNPGFGGSVVSDVTIFDPNVVATLGQ